MGGLLDGVIRSVASNLIGSLGTTGVLITLTGGVYDPATGTISTPATSTETTVKCSPPSPYSVGQIDGTNIQTGDMKVIIPALDYDTMPTTAQKLRIRGYEYTVVSVMPISSGNLEAAWEIQIRR